MKRTTVFLLIILTAFCMVCCDKDSDAVDTQKATPAQESLPSDNTGSQKNDLSFDFSDAVPTGAAMIDDFGVIPQLPELPTGCEVTSLTMVLNYYGIAADKCDIADHYLEKGEVGKVDFRDAFEGDPRDEASFGCYAPVIVKAANSYLKAKGSYMQAKDVTGAELEQLLTCIDRGIPVIVWGTVDCETPVNQTTWKVDGKELKWYSPEHCMVLVGYNDHQVTVADPLKGEKRSFDRDLFKSRFYALFQQAIILE